MARAKKKFFTIFTELDFSPLGLLKITALVFVGFIALAIVVSLFGSSVRSISSLKNTAVTPAMPSIAPGGHMYDYALTQDGYEESRGVDDAMLSAERMVYAPMTPYGTVTTGDTAEDFEVTEYHSTIETSDSTATCAAITEIKALDYVIFENANENDRNCHYTFKVQHAYVDEILAFIDRFEPEELSATTYTIKNVVDNFINESEILEKKRTSIDETLENALLAYDEITEMATRTQNAESLATIINSKIQLIERLTQERIAITEQLDRIERSKSEQLDRLVYTYFHIQVYENRYVDVESLKDSWQLAVKEFIRDVNRVVQDVTINLVVLAFLIAQYLLYLFILVVVAKYVWRGVRYLWYR